MERRILSVKIQDGIRNEDIRRSGVKDVEDTILKMNQEYDEPASDTLAEFIKPCSKRDPKVNECIRDSFEHLRPYLTRGIPEIKLDPFEPMKIPKLSMDNGHGAVRLRAIFSNITVHGVSNYSIHEVKGDVKNYRIDISLGIPRIETAGNYDVNGQILLVPVRGKGDFWALFSNITGVGKLYGKEITKGGTKFMKVERVLVDYKVARARFKIRDHVNKNSVLSEAMNQFLNQNALELMEEMKPAAATAFSRHFKSLLNSMFVQIPIPVWLQD